MMNREKANKVYDILVNLGGASESERPSFIFYHCGNEDEYMEWRFMGKLGYGGKYRGGYNQVDCYLEDETPSRIKLMAEINCALAKII